MSTIRNLRGVEKTLRKELDALKRAQEDANKSELEKLTTRLSEAERKAIDAEERIASTNVRADFTEKALSEGVVDVKLAYLAAQSAGLLGAYDDGEVSGHDFKALRKQFPHLFKASGSADGSAGATRAPAGNTMNDFIRRSAGR